MDTRDDGRQVHEGGVEVSGDEEVMTSPGEGPVPSPGPSAVPVAVPGQRDAPRLERMDTEGAAQATDRPGSLTSPVRSGEGRVPEDGATTPPHSPVPPSSRPLRSPSSPPSPWPDPRSPGMGVGGDAAAGDRLTGQAAAPGPSAPAPGSPTRSEGLLELPQRTRQRQPRLAVDLGAVEAALAARRGHASPSSARGGPGRARRFAAASLQHAAQAAAAKPAPGLRPGQVAGEEETADPVAGLWLGPLGFGACEGLARCVRLIGRRRGGLETPRPPFPAAARRPRRRSRAGARV